MEIERIEDARGYTRSNSTRAPFPHFTHFPFSRKESLEEKKEIPGIIHENLLRMCKNEKKIELQLVIDTRTQFLVKYRSSY